MSYTQADLDAIESAIKSGLKRVQYRDRTVEYRDISEMRSIASEIRTSLTTVKASTRIYMTTSKGL